MDSSNSKIFDDFIVPNNSVPKWRIHRLWCRRRRRCGADFGVRADLKPNRAGTKSDCAVREVFISGRTNGHHEDNSVFYFGKCAKKFVITRNWK